MHSWLRHGLRIAAAWLAAVCLCACGGGGASSPAAPTRAFLMGATPFQASYVGTTMAFPDWKFENMGDRDLLSVHVDDFWGVPWDHCNASGCTNLPAAWWAQWQPLAAKASGKTLYLAVSPLGDRKTLAPRVQADGSTAQRWNTAVDANGCYLFASDPAAAAYRDAYIGYVKTVVDLVGPKYLSPAIEINIPFVSCPAQKTAWIAWYAQVHAALKTAYPSLIVFPTFQMESMYGASDAASRCAAGTSYTQCFDTRLAEALTIPGDRIAFSTYPLGWKYSAEFNFDIPKDTYTRVRQATARPIWISETGWAAVRVRTAYPHGASGSCGADLLTPTIDVPGVGTLDVANDAAQAAYARWLLDEAQAQKFEAVIWWLERDYLDGAIAATCPCTPADSETCKMADVFYSLGGDFGEFMLRGFGNMALRHRDGTPRAAAALWHEWAQRPHRP